MGRLFCRSQHLVTFFRVKHSRACVVTFGPKPHCGQRKAPDRESAFFFPFLIRRLPENFFAQVVKHRLIIVV